MKKKLLSLLLSLALCLTLLPTAALAAGETYLWQNTTDNKIYYSTTEPSTPATDTGTELTAGTDYYSLGGTTATTYKLMSDVTIDKPILVTGTVTLDLNGYVLKYDNSTTGSVIRVGNTSTTPTTTGSLTLTDSRATNSTATHYFTENDTTHLWSLCPDSCTTHTTHKTVTGGIITGGTGTNIGSSSRGGGGVFVDKGSTFTMNGGHIVGCTAANGGGGVFVYGSSGSNTTFTMSGGSIQGCTASGNGGGVLLENPGPQFTMSNDTLIASCTANNGGGVSAGGGTTFTMSGGTIENCTAKGDGSSTGSDGGKGGGVLVGGTFTMSGGTISNCIANGGSTGGTAAQGGGVYVNSNTCTLQGGTISSCTATGGGVDDPRGGGVFVYEGKPLTVGGGSTALTITGNTSGTGPANLTTDNIYLNTYDSSAATITVADGGLAADSSISLTPSTASDLDLSTLTTGGDLSTNGYTWDTSATPKTLTLQNKILGNITLPNADTKIIIQGNVIVNKIGDNISFAKALTIEGADGTNPNLTVNERIACTTNANPLTLKNVTATVGCINWTHSDATVQGLKLENSHLTVNGITESPDITVGIIAGQITLDNTSTITLNGGFISGNGEGVLSNVPGYCPTGGTYSIGSTDSVNYFLLKDGNKVTNITLQGLSSGDGGDGGDSAPTPSTPPSYSDGGPTYYRVTVSEPVNGAVEASAKRATSGTTVTITVSPASGYELETLTVLDRRDREVALTDKGDGKYTFKMPASNVTVEATFMEDNSMLNFFVDVTADKYYYDAVLWAAKNGITGGIDENHFGPDRSCTRAQAVTFLYRAALALGLDVSVGEDTNILSYNDAFEVPEYAIPAFQWAVGAGIVQGNNGNLEPNSNCTRAQIVTFLFRFAAANGMDLVTLQELVSGFNDAAQVPGYALPAFNWALAGGIVQGNNGNLMPNQTCTRAQIVTMLYRLLGE